MARRRRGRPGCARFGAFSFFDYAITTDQTLRVQYSYNKNEQKNLGIGGYDQVARSYSNGERSHFIRIQEAGPLGRRFFTNTRLQMNFSDTESQSVVQAPTIRVNDAFTSGGARGSWESAFGLLGTIPWILNCLTQESKLS